MPYEEVKHDVAERNNRAVCYTHFHSNKVFRGNRNKKQPEHIIKYIPAAEYPSGSYDPLENI